MKNDQKKFFAALAWVRGSWQRNVLLTVDAAGLWSGIEFDAPLASRTGATPLDGPVLPGLVNAHSHAFQRAIVGLAERASRSGAGDNFWSWRDRMYSAAARITPDQLEAIATFLYAELLAGGYTQVCEFHYLHNAVDGKPYAEPLKMSLALVRAAQRVGLGLTLLPTLYLRSGFGASGLRDDQRRFAGTPERLMRMVQRLQQQTQSSDNINVGLAVHSLRAADEAAIGQMAAFAASGALPVHIHMAEQTQEVQDCIRHTGQRPVEWLLAHQPVNAQWNLVHATHTTAAELKAVAESGASIVICPSTEANLGDGVFDYAGYAGVGGRWSIGSDSHVTRSWSEELRLLEYSQRLTHRQRNVAAQAGTLESSAAALFEAALAGAHSATARPLGAIALGHRADFLVLDDQAPALLGIPSENLLDALVFSSPDAGYKQVFVAGQQRVSAGRAGEQNSHAELLHPLAQRFKSAMKSLWS
jgi:formimidoylglutamate deiminase